MFELLQALQVQLHALAARAGPRGADRVGSAGEHAVDRDGFHFMMVARHALPHRFRFAVFFQKLRADRGVRTFDLVVDGLANVMEQSDATADGFVLAQLGGHHTFDAGDLDGVVEHVLREAVTEFQASEQFQYFRMNGLQTELERGVLAGFADHLIEFSADLGNLFLDAGGIDAAIGDQTLDGHARQFTAHGVETAEHDSLRRIVDEHIDAGRRFKCADIAAFAPDDAALHFLARQRDRATRRRLHVLGGASLDGDGDDAFGFAVGIQPGVFQNAA